MEWNSQIISELWHYHLLPSEDCTFEECQDFYKRVELREPLPPDVWQIGDTARFIRLKDGVPTHEEIQLLLQLRQVRLLKSIRRIGYFFIIPAVLLTIFLIPFIWTIYI